jgi:hypothetical protein
MAGALDGIRVIDFGQYLAGPLAALPRRPGRPTATALACISKGCPFAGDGTMVPVASTAQPAVSRRTSCA